MKTIRNVCLQGLEIYLIGPRNTSTTYYLPPKAFITVDEHCIGDQIKTLVRRRMLKVSEG